MTTYTTTPIFYANGEPHLGHVYSGILADIFHRYRRLIGQPNVLITGTDEHGKKIALAAEAHQRDIHSFVDEKAKAFSDLWESFSITPDVFVRTTDVEHKAKIREIWSRLVNKGDIFLGSYSGEYCVACEQFYSERELNNKRCPVHGKEVETVEEATYLFRLENYRQSLLTFYRDNPDFITPRHFQESLIEQLEIGELEDLSVSRVNNSWGVNVPGDVHTVYVWIDALFSYITAIERSGGSQQDIAETVHVLGKDILKFHAIIWPAFLLALDLPLPKKLVVHSWWTIEGKKISKSNPETTVNPRVFSDKLTSDGLRYAFTRQKPLSRDGNVSIVDFIELVNADLANSFANLVKRNNTLIQKHFNGELPKWESILNDDQCKALFETSLEVLNDIRQAYEAFSPYEVTVRCKQLVDDVNSFFHCRQPWLINKGLEHQHVAATCFVVANIVRQVAIAVSPITPELSASVLSEFGEKLDDTCWETLSLDENIRLTSVNSHFKRV
ncbi:methionine--tRNA ligase [Veronia nyctiphanis]|uniref:Methionine--tRNA ligase n=1 Tax=Veronia nyctiphanis TaxID=1278244 RepID=A0A4Q0YMB7_9GAMM|nr:methionine--tRNA ligase [Veronia nyctiphanis]RXJ71525.1 methionine--tRNA ligase [Veronia nyctiphanis]